VCGERGRTQRHPFFLDQQFVNSKGEEVAAVQEILDRLAELPGCVLTFDALHTNHKTMEKAVVVTGAEFIVQVKGNTSDFEKRIKRILDMGGAEMQRAQTIDPDHGRIDLRRIEMVPTSPVQTGWPHVHTVCRVTRERDMRRRGESIDFSRKETLYACSFNAATRSAEDVLQLIRGHWTIENCLHHVKDRSMNEDRNRASERGCGRVMCCIRSIVALVLGRSKESLSVVQRRFSAKIHQVLSLLSCRSVKEWECIRKPYKLA